MVDSTKVGEDAIDLYYEDVGEGPALTFVHGFSANHLSWWQQLPTFAETYRCLAPDQRRFGLSKDTADVGVGAFADDLTALLDDLGIERTALVGHSMGGWTAASFATQFPDRVSALVLSATPGGLIDPERHQRLMAEAGEPPEVDPLSPEASYLADAIGELNLDAPPSWEETRPVLDELPLDAATIVGAGIPVLLIAGEADGFMPDAVVADVADRLDAQTAIVEEAGHSVYFEQPAAFNRHLAAFLDGHVP